MATHKHKRSHDISRLLNFTDADLKTNRDGALSRWQLICLLGILLHLAFSYLLALFCTLVLVFMILYVMMDFLVAHSLRDAVLAGGGLFAGLIGIGLACLFLYSVWTTGIDLIIRRPHQITGPLRKKMELGFMPCLVINDQTFPVKERVYRSLVEGRVYRLYYSRSQQLLTVELIDDGIKTFDLTLQSQAESHPLRTITRVIQWLALALN